MVEHPAPRPRLVGQLRFARARDLAAARVALESDPALRAACAGGWDEAAGTLTCDAQANLTPALSPYPPTRPAWMSAASLAARHASAGRLDVDFLPVGAARSWRVLPGGYIAPVVGRGGPRDGVASRELSSTSDHFRPGPIVFDSAGSLLVGGGANLTTRALRGAACAAVELDARTLSDLQWFTGFDGPVEALALSLDERLLHAVDGAGNTRTFERRTGEERARRRSAGDWPGCLHARPDGTLWSVLEGRVARWSASLKPLGESPLGGAPRYAADIALSPDGSLVAVAHVGVGVWDTARPEARLAALECRGITSIAFSPGGELLAIVEALHDGLTFFTSTERWFGPEAPKRVRLLEARTMRELWCRGDLGNPSSVAFCGPDTLLCAGRNERSWTLWELRRSDGQCTGRRVHAAEPFVAYPDSRPDWCRLAVARGGATAALATEAGVLMFRLAG
jgi:hypothetical protein